MGSNTRLDFFILCDSELVTLQTIICRKHSIRYLNPREITDKIFIIKKTDDEDITFETIVSNK